MELARSAIGLSEPNPRVGCVIVASAGGQVIGEGHTQQAGGPHAEVMALQDAAARGNSTQGATVYVTLEPCSHHGRTPPCCDALVQAGVGRVIASIADPNPLVAGQGFAQLRAAGIDVEVGPCADESRELNIGFFSRMQRGLPWVRLKIAASLDGRTALDNGSSQWITAQAARADGHAWRARGGAILTGIGTVIADNPRLDVRLAWVARQPPIVIVDSRLQLPLDASVFIEGRPVLVYAGSSESGPRRALETQGATVVVLPDSRGKVDLAAMLRDLATRGVNELHVEAGHKLNGSLVRAGLVDEFLVYLAPKLLGDGEPMADIGPLTDLSQALQLSFRDATVVGSDLRILARVERSTE